MIDILRLARGHRRALRASRDVRDKRSIWTAAKGVKCEIDEWEEGGTPSVGRETVRKRKKKKELRIAVARNSAQELGKKGDRAVCP